MPLLRNIAGFSVGAVTDPNDAQARVLPDEWGSGGGNATYWTPPGDTVNPPAAGGDGGGGVPVHTSDPPVRTSDPAVVIEEVVPVYPREVVTMLPPPNEVAVVPGGLPTGKVDWLGVIATSGAVLAMAGLHPFKKVGTGVLIAGTLAVLYWRMSANKAPAGGIVIEQPNTL